MEAFFNQIIFIRRIEVNSAVSGTNAKCDLSMN